MRDCETNVVYVTQALKRYPAVFNGISAALAEVGVERRLLTETKNVWCRDYLPLQVGNRFVRFNYKGYGDPDAKAKGLAYNDYPQIVVSELQWDQFCMSAGITAGGPRSLVTSDIIMDTGGNCVRYDDRCLVTEIVFQHNPSWGRQRLIDQLEGLLQADIIFLPPEPGDDLGHTDGIAKFIDADHVLINDYRAMRNPAYREYLRTVKGIFEQHGIETIPFPYYYDRCPELDEAAFRKRFPDADDCNPGWGYAVNYLQVKGAILYPTFGIPDDAWTEACLWDAFPDVKLFPIDCSDLSMEGGLVNCTTMNYVM